MKEIMWNELTHRERIDLIKILIRETFDDEEVKRELRSLKAAPQPPEPIQE